MKGLTLTKPLQWPSETSGQDRIFPTIFTQHQSTDMSEHQRR